MVKENKIPPFINGMLSFSIAVIILFSGCYSTQRAKGVAYLRYYKSDSLEIEIPYTIKGRGSFHNFTFQKFKDSSADWIYIAKPERKVTADRLTLIYTKGYLPQRNLKVEININDSTLVTEAPLFCNRVVL